MVINTVKSALEELRETRRHIDADIADLERIIARHEGRGAAPAPVVPVGRGAAGTLPGAAQREILELMSNGDLWSPSQLAKNRGSSANAAGAALRRLIEQGLVRQVRTGRYQIVTPSEGDENAVAGESSNGTPAPPAAPAAGGAPTTTQEKGW